MRASRLNGAGSPPMGPIPPPTPHTSEQRALPRNQGAIRSRAHSLKIFTKVKRMVNNLAKFVISQNDAEMSGGHCQISSGRPCRRRRACRFNSGSRLRWPELLVRRRQPIAPADVKTAQKAVELKGSAYGHAQAPREWYTGNRCAQNHSSPGS